MDSGVEKVVFMCAIRLRLIIGENSKLDTQHLPRRVAVGLECATPLANS